mgnify:CR=1 FL=1
MPRWEINTAWGCILLATHRELWEISADPEALFPKPSIMTLLEVMKT